MRYWHILRLPRGTKENTKIYRQNSRLHEKLQSSGMKNFIQNSRLYEKLQSVSQYLKLHSQQPVHDKLQLKQAVV
jgi:hypothetical protein